MSDLRCPSCGGENEPKQVYCTHCGGILKAVPSGGSGASLPPTVAAAARRLQSETEHGSLKGVSILKRLWGAITYLISVALGVIVVLMLMSPKDLPSPESSAITDAPAIVDRLVTSSRQGPSVVSQPVINAFLRSAAYRAWNPPADFIPAPDWSGGRVFLGNRMFAYSFVLTVFNYPIHFLETFRLEGSAGNWRLSADSGSIGLLQLNQRFLPVLTLLTSFSTAPLVQYLSLLKEATTLEIRYGNVVFTTR